MGDSPNRSVILSNEREWKVPSWVFFIDVVFVLLALFMVYQVLADPSREVLPIIAFITWLLLIVIMALITPTRITIKDEELIIKWIGRWASYQKATILKISKVRYPAQIYFFRIIQNQELHKSTLSENLPIMVYWEPRPYYDLEPSKVYDVLTEIETWLTNRTFDHNLAAPVDGEKARRP